MSASNRLDPERQARARAYARQHRRLFFAELGISVVLLAAWLGLGWPETLKAWLAPLAGARWLQVAAFGAIFFLSFQLLSWPLEYFGSFVLPHRYGLSNQTPAGWVRDQAVGLALTAVLGLPVLEGAYWLLDTTGGLWWVWAAGGYVILTILLSILAPTLIFPLFNKFVPLGPEHGELIERLKRLAEAAGTRVSGVFRFDLSKRTKAANAALTGLGRTRRIILGDTLLSEFSEDEIETVIAHELGHHVHRDIPLGIAFSSVSTFVGLGIAAAALEWGASRLGFEGPADLAAMPLLALVLGAFGLVMMPLSNGLSRWREVRADRYALAATGKPNAFAEAMTRLANQNLADADPEPWVVFLFHSHPPIRDRVALATGWPQGALREPQTGTTT